MTNVRSPVSLPPERRRSTRSRCLLACTLAFGDGAFSVPARVKDRTPVGLRVQIDTPMLLPNRLFVGIHQEGRPREAEVMWRRGDLVGLRYLGDVDIDGMSDLSVKVLRRILDLARA